ncbi:MAG: hypothetical protein PHT78_12695 [Desulfitobacteriaceae bacterium]|nr:hypothetical protein [Desulfitobacteriaceae bacterium]MDD4754077.1 hypothetical protein [Desulfitobacteriaceae bacterium]
MADLPDWSIYTIYTGILAIILLAAVPRIKFKKLAIYGIIFGAVADIFWILLIGILGVGKYINYGPFGFLGFPFFPPIAWSIYFVIYFYFLPRKNFWPYVFAFIAAIYSIVFSNVLDNLGIFKWTISNVWVPFFVYVTWHIGATWIFLKLKRSKWVPD